MVSILQLSYQLVTVSDWSMHLDFMTERVPPQMIKGPDHGQNRKTLAGFGGYIAVR